MSFLKEESESIETVKELLSQMMASKPFSKMSSESLDKAECQEALVYLERYQALALELSQYPLDGFPVNYVRNTIIAALSNALPHVLNFANFSDNSPNKAILFSNATSNLARHYESFFLNISNVILQATRPDILKGNISELNQIIENSKISLESLSKWFTTSQEEFQMEISASRGMFREVCAQMEKKLVEQQESIDTLKATLGDIGTSTFAKKFEQEAAKQAKQSWMWLGVVILITSGLLVYLFQTEAAVIKASAAAATDKSATGWSVLATRGLTMSVGSVILFLCIRCFAACRHNSVVNKHRDNALSTFALFRDSAADNDTKNAILLEATRAVFTQVQSGYLKAANEANAPTQIVEMIRNTATTVKDH